MSRAEQYRTLATLFRWVHRHFRESFVDLDDLDLIAEFGPAAEHFGIFLGGAAGVLRFPVAQENVVCFAIAVEQVASVAFSRDDGSEFAKGVEGGGFVRSSAPR